VLAPVAGLLVDRREARAVLIVASLAQAAVAASLAFTLDSVAAILILAVMLGVGFAVAQPAEFALVPVIAGKKRLAPLHDRVDDGRGVLPEQDLKVSDAVYGRCFAAWTVGMVGGALVAARRAPGAALALAVLGRAFAAYNGLRNGAEPFALAGGGLLVAAIGARMTLALAGAIPVPRGGGRSCVLSLVGTARTGGAS